MSIFTGKIDGYLTIIFLLIMSFQLVNAIDLTIKYKDGTYRTEYYEENTDILSFNYGRGKNMVEIIGLEKFLNLKELWL